jgi:hypothetical protein
MPLRRSAVGRASRKDEVSALLGWNGVTEDAASGDDRPSRYVTCIAEPASWWRLGRLLACRRTSTTPH